MNAVDSSCWLEYFAGTVVDHEANLSTSAAKVGKDFKRAMADSIIYATSQEYTWKLWTQDKHLDGLSEVQYFPKEKEDDV